MVIIPAEDLVQIWGVDEGGVVAVISDAPSIPVVAVAVRAFQPLVEIQLRPLRCVEVEVIGIIVKIVRFFELRPRKGAFNVHPADKQLTFCLCGNAQSRFVHDVAFDPHTPILNRLSTFGAECDLPGSDAISNGKVLSALATEALASALLVLRGEEDIAVVEDVLIAILREILRQLWIHGEVLLLKLTPIVFLPISVFRLHFAAKRIDPTEKAVTVPASASAKKRFDLFVVLFGTACVVLGEYPARILFAPCGGIQRRPLLAADEVFPIREEANFKRSAVALVKIDNQDLSASGKFCDVCRRSVAVTVTFRLLDFWDREE